MEEIELSAGIIEYEDTGGSGPVVVLLHGLVMDGSLWQNVVRELSVDYRCVIPTLPLGGHRRPMREGADLSPHGQAALQAEFLEMLDLREVTLVGNDVGHFQLTAGLYPERMARLVITSCEAFENFPPGLPGRVAAIGMNIPGGSFLLAQALRWHALRRLPFTLGWMAKRPISNEMIDIWLRPLQTMPLIRRDLRKYIRTLDRGDMLAAAEGLRRFERPALVIWAKEDRVMPPAHGRRLAELLPNGRLIEVADSYTFLPLDQPEELAGMIRQFIQDTA